ncbi:unnamed protein product, partial [Ilex paraguariensis]
EDDNESIKDIQQAYDQLVEEFLKENKRVHALSVRLKMSEDEKQALYIDLVKSKDHYYGLEEDIKSLKDKVSFLESECHGLVESKKSLEFKLIKLDRGFHESQEFSEKCCL